jgi:glycosyltransferase involved in cell wall biosynthesis
LGEIAKFVKSKFPHVRIFTFFHNIEVRFFYGSLVQNRSAHGLAVLLANYLAEKKSVKFSDEIICLSRRDSMVLGKIYGRAVTHVSPIALKDHRPAHSLIVRSAPREKFALFVGGTFYANKAGITWFVKHVVPRIQIKICIVGRGFEALKDELELDGKVEVVGAVDCLAQWYQDAHFIIAPIFDGSGMKTKVAEALMYGKKVVGTPEAFTGYDDITGQVGWVCESANDFVVAISAASEGITQSFDPALRQIYEKSYSMNAAKARLAKILS